jgi:hypothetical protein
MSEEERGVRAGTADSDAGGARVQVQARLRAHRKGRPS